jgi:hypothetical protein
MLRDVLIPAKKSGAFLALTNHMGQTPSLCRSDWPAAIEATLKYPCISFTALRPLATRKGEQVSHVAGMGVVAHCSCPFRLFPVSTFLRPTLVLHLGLLTFINCCRVGPLHRRGSQKFEINFATYTTCETRQLVKKPTPDSQSFCLLRPQIFRLPSLRTRFHRSRESSLPPTNLSGRRTWARCSR